MSTNANQNIEAEQGQEDVAVEKKRSMRCRFNHFGGLHENKSNF